MTTNPERHFPIEGTHNFRDAGGYPTRDGGSVRWRTLFRSDSLHDLTDAGMEAVRALGVRTSIDLRTPPETALRPSAFANGGDITYQELGLSVRGSDPGAPRAQDLWELNRMFLDTGRESMSAIMGALASGTAFPIVVNCTVGKDRTGLVVALLHELAGVHRDDIVADYALSGQHTTELVSLIHERSVAVGRDPEQMRRLLACDPETMAASLAHLDSAHGGIDRYMRTIGIGGPQASALRDALVER